MQIIKNNLKLSSKSFALVVIGALSWSLTMIKSGLVYSYGMGFWGPNGHDGIWHMALINSFAKGLWQIPVFAGENIRNYHIGFDLIVAMLHKITFIPVVNLYFQIIPPILSFLVGYAGYRFVFVWTKSRPQSFWATFFIFFGGSFGWLVTLIRSQQIGGESLFWSQQAISTLVNPPFALSLIFIFCGLYYLLIGLKNKNKKQLLFASCLFGVLIQIKVYAGFLVIFSLLTGGIWAMLKRQGTSVLKVFLTSTILSILLFSPLDGGVDGQVIFTPFWFLETLFSSPDRFYWPRLAEALINYKSAGMFVKGVAAYEFALLIFLIGNFGTRLIGFFFVVKKAAHRFDYQYIDVLVVTIIIAGIVIPLLFIQSGTPWNTIQFLYYSLIFSGILAGIELGKLVERSHKLLPVIITLTVVLLTIPTSVGTLIYNYLPSRPPAKISNEELQALKFLSDQPDGVVFTQPFDKIAADLAVNNPPRSLYLYESTAYVSALSNHQTFLEDQVNLEITGYDWRTRRDKVDRFFKDFSYDGKLELLDKEHGSYVYVLNSVQEKYKDLQFQSHKIFENSEVSIYKVAQ